MFTLNNPTVAEKQLLLRIISDDAYRGKCKIEYIVFQTEKVTTTHIQGYIEFKTGYRPRLLSKGWKKKKPWRRCRWDRVDHPAKAIVYCKKSATRLETGISGEAGTAKKSQNDSLASVVQAMAEGDTLDEILDAHPIMDLKWNKKIIQKYLRDKQWPEDREIEIYVGPTNVGKSTYARQHNPDYFPVPGITAHNKRHDWEDYRGQACVIIDEFHDGYMPYKQILRFFDKFEYQVESKGFNFPMKSGKLILTLNADKDPKTWYRGVKDKSALERRFNDRVKIFDVSFSGDERYHHIVLRTYAPVVLDFSTGKVTGGFKFDDAEQSYRDQFSTWTWAEHETHMT